MTDKQITSAGGVVYKKIDDVVEVYLCKHKEYGYVLPKGKVEIGETIQQAAQREVEEETGFKLEPKDYLANISYVFTSGDEQINKIVHFFTFCVENQMQAEDNFKLEKSISKGVWVRLLDAPMMLAHKSEGKVCQKLLKL